MEEMTGILSQKEEVGSLAHVQTISGEDSSAGYQPEGFKVNPLPAPEPAPAPAPAVKEPDMDAEGELDSLLGNI